MKYWVFIISGIIVVLSCIIFFLFPSSLTIFSFSGEMFFNGEVWRIVTFPFTHINLNHLVENVVAISITSFLALEFGLTGKYFLYCFLLSSILVALTEAFLFPAIIIAGASLGIYAILGALSIKGSNFIPKYILVPLLGLSVFIKYLFSAFSMDLLKQSLFHFSGFVYGIAILYLFTNLKRKKKVLQVM